jgi:hypothetical protein
MTSSSNSSFEALGSTPSISTGEKPVTTKDIANLYSHLQTMIENVPKSPRSANSLDTPSSGHSDPHLPLPLTPTTSSKNLHLNTPMRKPREPDCPCHHILVSKDSKHCALCDDVIPILSEIQQDREQKRNRIKDYKEQLQVKQMETEKQIATIKNLEQNIQQVTEKLESTQSQHTSLKQDMVILQKKMEAEKLEATKAKKAQASVENELEELSQRLFEEANGMVANEKKAKHAIELQYKQLKQELVLVRQQMEAEELQLKELKLKMGDIMESESASSIKDDSTSTSTADKRASRDMQSLFTHQSEEDASIDPLLLNEFDEFTRSTEPNLRKIPFFKHALVEDIEPCLRFGPHARLSPKKLCEAILTNTCFIEEAPYGFAQEQAKRANHEIPLKISAAKSMIWERLGAGTTPHFTGCQACSRTNSELPYRFRISMLDDWACIDRYCRDRLVAVCEFYMFIRNIRQGYYSGRTNDDLYQESTRLKLQMFYARYIYLYSCLCNIGPNVY